MGTGGGCPDPVVAPGGPCPVECTGGCVDSVCLIDCEGTSACANAILQCPEAFSCEVGCSKNSACANVLVQCSELYDCSVSCDGVNACANMDIRCGAGVCHLECGGSVSSVCANAEVLCSSNACTATCVDKVNVPRLDCGSSCSCVPC